MLAAGDTAAAAVAVLIALWLWSIPAGEVFSAAFVRERAAWFLGALLWLAAAGVPAAAPSVAFSFRQTAAALIRGAAVLVLAYLAIYFYTPRGSLPRLVVLYFLWEALVLTLAWRLVFIAAFSRERFRQRAIIIGSGAAAATALRLVRQHRARRSHVVSVVTDGPEADPELRGVPAIAPSELVAAVSRHEVSEIILAHRSHPSDELLQILHACQEAGIELVRVQTLIEQVLRRVPVDLLEPDWLMTDLADAMRMRDASWLGKRALDMAGALAGVALAVIAGPFIALAVRLDSRGPVFYRQARLGRGGRPFVIVKFRTMREDAERPGEARWADRKDQRVTRVGRVLRMARLDELPQFLNVLKGEMSLVGPRPERAEFVAQLQEAIPFYRARLMVPPGLTGWAQVNFPYGDSVDAARAKLEYDLYYVKHRSLAFDCVILAKTLGTVLRMRGF
jgi:exopolysaccharide biosynthesis polyprenyl glycosylphosphotransferase